MFMTMSSSSAPASTAWRVSAALVRQSAVPPGKEIAAAACTPDPATSSMMTGSQCGDEA